MLSNQEEDSDVGRDSIGEVDLKATNRLRSRGSRDKFLGAAEDRTAKRQQLTDAPRMAATKHGTINDDFTLNVDLAPSILAAAGLDAPKTMQGRDISALYLSDEGPQWRDEFFYEHPMHRQSDFIPASEALVRKGWKYFYWPGFEREQLFNIHKDPMEENDLAANPEHTAQLAEMRMRFAELKAAAEYITIINFSKTSIQILN